MNYARTHLYAFGLSILAVWGQYTYAYVEQSFGRLGAWDAFVKATPYAIPWGIVFYVVLGQFIAKAIVHLTTRRNRGIIVAVESARGRTGKSPEARRSGPRGLGGGDPRDPFERGPGDGTVQVPWIGMEPTLTPGVRAISRREQIWLEDGRVIERVSGVRLQDETNRS